MRTPVPEYNIMELVGFFDRDFDKWYPVIEPLVEAQMDYHAALDAPGNPGKFGDGFSPADEYRGQAESSKSVAVFAAVNGCVKGAEPGADDVLGILSCFVFADAGFAYDVAYIEDLHVAERARGRGIGSALMKAALNWVNARSSVKFTTLEVWKGNEDKLGFYGRFGFAVRDYELVAENPSFTDRLTDSGQQDMISARNEEIPSMSRERLEQMIRSFKPIYDEARDETGYPSMPLSTERMGEMDGCVWLEEGGEPIAYLFYTDHRETGKIGRFEHDQLYSWRFGKSSGIYIEQVAVKVGRQNAGIGQQLYGELEKLFPDTALYAHVSVANRQSLRFHGRSGFVPIGDYIGDDYHALLMEKLPLRHHS